MSNQIIGEELLYNALYGALIKYVDPKKIIREFPLGRSFRADCVVLGSDNRTPILCFEFKQKNVSMGRGYRRIAEIYSRYVGIDACYLVYPEGDKVVIADGNRKYVIGEKSDEGIDLFLGIHANEVVIESANKESSDSIQGLKRVAYYVSILSILVVVPLDILGIFPLTYERLIFIALVVVLLVLPFLLRVVVAHPDLLKLLEIMTKGVNR
jgi:hypothetical protein